MPGGPAAQAGCGRGRSRSRPCACGQHAPLHWPGTSPGAFRWRHECAASRTATVTRWGQVASRPPVPGIRCQRDSPGGGQLRDG